MLALVYLYWATAFFFMPNHSWAGDAIALPDTIAKLKAGVVAVGTVQKTRRPPSIFRGTGFVIADGLHIATNAHVVPEKLDQDKNEMIAVFAGNAKATTIHRATKIAEDRDHDLAILRIDGPALKALSLGDSQSVREGEIYAFTGFPIGKVRSEGGIGLVPNTLRLGEGKS